MTAFRGDPNFDHGRAEGTLILLVNLGTPDAPTTGAVRRYLAEFLSDPRVIELPSALRWLLLHGIVLRVRPRRSAHAYQQVWRDDGSPLLVYANKQAEALSVHLASQATDAACSARVPVRVAMRYGSPSIADVLAEFRGQGLRRLLVVPMYPQYSGSTTGSVFDAIAAELRQWRRVPALRMVSEYHDFGPYIDALAASVHAHWQTHGQPDGLLLSFHGLPQRYLFAGDPYFCHCHATARLLAAKLDFPAERVHVSFQSRVGREKWLQPYTDQTFKRLAGEGVRNLHVLCPGFAADCLETLEEICIGGEELFKAAGGEQFTYIPALNDRPEHIGALADLVTAHAGDWLLDNGPELSLLDARKQRAESLGKNLETY